MKTSKKLKQYFEYAGVRQCWFAKRIGVPPTFVSAILAERNFPTKKHWEALISQTMGYVTLEDLVADFIAIEMKKLGLVEVRERANGKSWVLTLKAPSKRRI